MTIDTNYIYFLISKKLKMEIEKKCIVKNFFEDEKMD